MSENELEHIADLYQAMGYVGASAAEIARLVEVIDTQSQIFFENLANEMPSLIALKNIDRQRAKDDLQRKRKMGRGKSNPHWRR